MGRLGPPTLARRALSVPARVWNPGPGSLVPWVVPGPASLHELRWAWRLRRAPVVTAAEHASGVGVDDIEAMISCDLCGAERFRALFRAWAGSRGQRQYHVVRCPECGFLYRQPGIKPGRL